MQNELLDSEEHQFYTNQTQLDGEESIEQNISQFDQISHDQPSNWLNTAETQNQSIRHDDQHIQEAEKIVKDYEVYQLKKCPVFHIKKKRMQRQIKLGLGMELEKKKKTSSSTSVENQEISISQLSLSIYELNITDSPQKQLLQSAMELEEAGDLIPN